MLPPSSLGIVDYGSCLVSAGGFADKPKGRALCRDYLCQLCTDDLKQRRLGFDEICRGWAKGTKAFKKAVLANQKDAFVRKVVEAEASETREPRWEAGLSKARELLARGESGLSDSRKGAEWKVATARWLRERYPAPHRWIAGRLNMGGAGSVQTLVDRHRRESAKQNSTWEKLNNYEILD